MHRCDTHTPNIVVFIDVYTCVFIQLCIWQLDDEEGRGHFNAQVRVVECQGARSRV